MHMYGQMLILPICRLVPTETPADTRIVAIEDDREKCGPVNKILEAHHYGRKVIDFTLSLSHAFSAQCFL